MDVGWVTRNTRYNPTIPPWLVFRRPQVTLTITYNFFILLYLAERVCFLNPLWLDSGLACCWPRVCPQCICFASCNLNSHVLFYWNDILHLLLSLHASKTFFPNFSFDLKLSLSLSLPNFGLVLDASWKNLSHCLLMILPHLVPSEVVVDAVVATAVLAWQFEVAIKQILVVVRRRAWRVQS